MTQQPPSGLRVSPGGAKLGTAVIVTAGAWTVTAWALVGAASGSYVVAYVFLSRLWIFIQVAAYVLTTIWLWGARRNADLVGPDQQRWSSLWVWAGWIVPLFGYFVPKQVIDDVWRSTIPDSGKPKTGWWWGTFIILQLINFVGIVAIDDIIAGGDLVVYDLIVAVVTTVAMVFWIRVVLAVSDAQDALAGA